MVNEDTVFETMVFAFPTILLLALVITLFKVLRKAKYTELLNMMALLILSNVA